MMPHQRIREICDGSEWDATVWAHPDANIFCSWMWGEYKARLGWRARRLVIADEAGDALALVQYQEKAKGIARFVHVQGGPLLTPKGERHAESALGAFLDHLALGRLDLVAVDFERFGSGAATLALLAHGFTPAVSRRHHTLEVGLAAGPEPIRKAAETRWRRALARAEGHEGLEARFLTDPEERLACFDAFTAMYAALKQRKGFANGFDGAVYRDLAANDPHHLFLEIRDRGALVLVRIAHLSRRRCTDFFAASTEQARASNAATLSVWRLVERAIAEGCEVFDHGGIDPAGNRGVYDFKRGLTRNVVQTGPVWLYGRTARLRDAAGAYLAFR